jgi:hypothetical protein
MRLIALFLCHVIATAVFAVAPPCPNNLLTNGSFETSTTAWTVSGTGVTSVAEPKDGASAMKLCPSTGLTRVYQTINATAGTTYSFTAWAKHNSGDYGQMFIKCMDASWSPLETKFQKMTPTALSGVYDQFALSITAPAGTVRMEVGFFASAACPTIDDACVTTGVSPLTCTLGATATEIVCNDNNTPGITTDDTWRCKLTVVANGGATCPPSGGVWYGSVTGTAAGNLIGNYGTPSLSASFPISAGNQTITFVDANNQNITGTLVVIPPSVCSSPPSTTCTNNLVSNSGFEFNLNDWTATGATISATAASGTKAIQVCQGQSLRQMKPTTSSQTLTLTYQARSTLAGANVLSYIKYLDGAWNVLTTEFYTAIPTTTAFSQFTLTKVAPAGAVWVEFGFWNFNAGCVLIDDICLSNNPCGNDVVPPVIVCPANITVQSTNGTNAVATWTAPTATDHCPGTVTVTASATSGQTFAVGATGITYTARDVAQNTAVCAFTVTVQSTQTGACGFLRTVAATKRVTASVSAIQPISSGFRVVSLNNFILDSIKIASLNIGTAGTAGVQTHAAMLKPGMVSELALDGNILAADTLNNAQFVFRKLTTSGAISFTKTFTINPPVDWPIAAGFPIVLSLNAISERTNCYIISGTHAQALSRSNFVVETDLNGNQIRVVNTDENISGTNSIGIITTQNGAAYGYTLNGGSFYIVSRLDTNYQIIWSHAFPQQYSAGKVEESSDGLYTYIVDNKSKIITKKLKQNGALVWEKYYSQGFAVPLNDYNGITTFSATNDGGIVLAIFDENSKRSFVKMNGSGNIEWSIPLPGTHDINKIKTLIDGYVLAGVFDMDWLVIKTDLAGNYLPDCETGNTTKPDLTIQNVSFTATTVAPGTSFQVKYDVRNLKATPTGNYKIKFYMAPNPANALTFRPLNVVDQLSLPANGQALQQTATLDIPVFTPLEAHYIFADIDFDNSVIEESETNNRAVSTSTVMITNAPAGGSDLELSITSDRTSVPQWSAVTLSVKAKNNSATSITDATIEIGLCGNNGNLEFQNANKIVYAATPVAPAGSTYNQVVQVWNTGTIPAGQTVTLTLQLFTLGAQNYRIMAWTTAQMPADPDSQPSTSPLKSATGTCATAQDDEAVITFGPTQLMSSNPNAQFEPLPDVGRAFLYPNPVKDVLTINLNDYLDQTDVTLIMHDAQGQVRFTESIDKVVSRLRQIPVHDLSPGWYLVRVQQAGMRERVGRVVVVRE